MAASGQVSRIDGRSHWVLTFDVDPAGVREVGPMEAPDGLALVERDRVVIADLPGGRWVIVAKLPAGGP